MWISTRGISQFWFQTRQILNAQVSQLERSSLILVPTSIDIS
jgi:hypothetical protein